MIKHRYIHESGRYFFSKSRYYTKTKSTPYINHPCNFDRCYTHTHTQSSHPNKTKKATDLLMCICYVSCRWEKFIMLIFEGWLALLHAGCIYSIFGNVYRVYICRPRCLGRGIGNLWHISIWGEILKWFVINLNLTRGSILVDLFKTKLC